MNVHITIASTLASIDSKIEDNLRDLTPSQYEITRQVIYHTADFEYYSQLQFTEDALNSGFRALKDGLPIIVDVPEIQVGIVPQLRKTFKNPVYCCATTGKTQPNDRSDAAVGLESLAGDRPNGIFAIGQDPAALEKLVELIQNKTINPSLAIATAPSLLDLNAKEFFQTAGIPAIYTDSPKGCAIVASAILNSLVALSWRASIKGMKDEE